MHDLHLKKRCDEVAWRSFSHGNRSDLCHSRWRRLTSIARETGITTKDNQFMSQHRSLKGASTIAAKRNVLKRFERVELLKKRGQWKDGAKVMGLPKTKPDA
jgi:small basic protein (TIGR04137 family)